MNERKQKKLTCFFLKNLSFRNSNTKLDALKVIEFLDQFMIATFLIKLTEFEKTGSIGKFLIPLGNSKTKFHNRN